MNRKISIFLKKLTTVSLPFVLLYTFASCAAALPTSNGGIVVNPSDDMNPDNHLIVAPVSATLPAAKSGGWVFTQPDGSFYKTPNPTNIKYHYSGTMAIDVFDHSTVLNLFRAAMEYWQ